MFAKFILAALSGPSKKDEVICAGCGEPITEEEYDSRHDICPDADEAQYYDVGEYHDRCCPACRDDFGSDGFVPESIGGSEDV